jgi:hypothetical protein
MESYGMKQMLLSTMKDLGNTRTELKLHSNIEIMKKKRKIPETCVIQVPRRKT